jgi:hypothetical protein
MANKPTYFDIRKRIDADFGDLIAFLMHISGILERMRVVISNDLGSCKRNGCSRETPCQICKELYRLDDDIEQLLKDGG